MHQSLWFAFWSLLAWSSCTLPCPVFSQSTPHWNLCTGKNLKSMDHQPVLLSTRLCWNAHSFPTLNPLSHRPLLPGWIPFVDPSLGSIHTYSHNLCLPSPESGVWEILRGTIKAEGQGQFQWGWSWSIAHPIQRNVVLKEAEEPGSTGKVDL